MRLLLVSLFIIFTPILFSQTKQLDSLLLAINKPVSNDTMRAFQYNELAWNFLDYSLSQAKMYQQKGFTYSRKIGYTDGEIDALNTLGIIQRIENKSFEAIKTYQEVIQKRKRQGRKDKLVGAYSNLGSVYYEMGNNAKALSNYNKAMELAYATKQTNLQLTVLMNIGVAYKSSGLYNEALKAFQKGLVLNKKAPDDFQEAQFYLNIATVYDQRKMIDQAIRYNEVALKHFRKLQNLRLCGTVLYNLGVEYRMQKNYKKVAQIISEMEILSEQLDEAEFTSSLEHLRANYLSQINQPNEAMVAINRSLQLADSTFDGLNYADLLLSKGDIYVQLKQFDQAEQFFLSGLQIVKKENDLIRLTTIYNSLSVLYKQKGDLKKALAYTELSNQTAERSALNDVTEQIATLNAINELDKKERDLKISNSKNLYFNAENQRQSNLIVAGSLISLLVLVLLGLSYKANQSKKKANKQLQLQKSEIELQKNLVDEKQKEMLDSIHYAKRIQQTLLAQETAIRKVVKSAFLFYRPKDIVSGDFYWSAEKDDKFFLAVCDSTGHGVPGAFMSLLNISFLSEAINVLELEQPGEILGHVRQKLIASISHSGAQDGIDGVLFVFDKKSKQLSYSAAHNGPVVVRNNEYFVYPADKMPIGLSDKLLPFTTHQIHLEEKDVIYAFTDGYADQFGGEKGKKFKSKQLHHLLSSCATSSFEKQLETIENTFDTWKSDFEQVDDVTVLGIQFY